MSERRGLSVLIVGNFLSAAVGTRTVCEELAVQLQARGHSVITTSHQRRRIARLLDMVATAWRVRHSYRVAQVDVYSGLAFTWAEAACWTLRRAGKPYILTLHGGNLPAFAGRWPRRVGRLLRSAVTVTAPSRYLAEALRQYGAPIRLLPNGMGVAHYPCRIRQNPAPRLIWLRAFHAIYNPALAPQVVARLVQAYADVHLVMVGPDKGDGSLARTQAAAAESGVADRLQVTGAVPKASVPAWLNRGDIFINTTNVDNTPVSVIEAMACGLCVVSTNVGGMPYLIEDGVDGLLVPPGDAEAMASAVQRVLTDPALAERLSQNARRKAEQFDWSVVMPQWEEILSTAQQQP